MHKWRNTTLFSHHPFALKNDQLCTKTGSGQTKRKRTTYNQGGVLPQVVRRIESDLSAYQQDMGRDFGLQKAQVENVLLQMAVRAQPF
jgi:hypothetical protein